MSEATISTFTDRRVRMTDELWEALDQLAAENGRNIADEVRVACLAHVKRHGLKLDADVTSVVSGRGRRGEGRRR